MAQLYDPTTMADHSVRTALKVSRAATTGGAWIDGNAGAGIISWAKQLGIKPEWILGTDGKPQYLVMTGETWLIVVTADKRYWAQVGTDRPEWLA